MPEPPDVERTVDRILSVAPTVCRLMGVDAPELCEAQPLAAVMATADDVLELRPVERVLLFLPDAIGRWMFREHRQAFDGVLERAAIVAPVRAVMPSVTPVCFASMFSGAQPAAHGIVKYERPVVRCDTVFDALIRGGKRPAIVAVSNCSMAEIFLEREMDYLIEESDRAVADRTLELLAADAHDAVFTYFCGYDKATHRAGPRSDEALAEFREALATFERLADAANAAWATRDRLIAFCPDHGAHHNEEDVRFAHGLDIPEDMDLNHYFGLAPGRQQQLRPPA